MKTIKSLMAVAMFAVGIGGALSSAQAASPNIMPDFSSVPTGWVTDRYDPASFANVGTYQGRNNVLGIGITSAGDFANRPANFQDTFYNTQGKQYALTGGAGSVLAADLWVPTSWGTATNGNVRTDMWGILPDPTDLTSSDPRLYPIIGFTNYGGDARFRVWDQNTGWVNLSSSVNYNAWTSLAIKYTGSAFEYSINGTKVYTDTYVGGSTSFSATIMQAYNFADPSITGATLANYTAHWANPVPEPETYALMLAGLGLMGFIARRRKQNLAA